MTTIKLDSKLGGGPAAAIEPHIGALYRKPGCRIMVIAELAHIERTQPAPDSDGEPSVKMRISALEIAAKEQEDAVREAQRALYLQRSAYGTIGEDEQIQLSEETLKLASGVLSDLELSRLHVGLAHWARYADRITQNPKLTISELRNELNEIAKGLRTVLSRAAVD